MIPAAYPLRTLCAPHRMVNPMELFFVSHIVVAGRGIIPGGKGYSMRLLLISAAAAALALASPALAQDHHGHGGHGGGDHNGGSHSAPKAAPAAHGGHAAPAAHAAPAPHAVPAAPAAQLRQHSKPGVVTTTQAPAAAYQKALRDAAARNQRERQNNNRGNHDNNSRGNDHHDNSRHDNGRHDNNNWRGNDDRHDGNWNNNRGSNDHRSWQGRFDRRNVTAHHHYRYRGNSWRWPSGYSYRRWTFGMTLPSLFWGSNYWINDYYDYGLGAPPPGTVWVRYGNDAILIDRYSGEILEVVYDQFY